MKKTYRKLESRFPYVFKSFNTLRFNEEGEI